MVSPQVFPQFPSSTMDVSNWTKAQRELYTAQSDRGASGRHRMEHLWVDEIRRYMECSEFGPGQEYIVAQIQNENGSYGYIKLEHNSQALGTPATNRRHNSTHTAASGFGPNLNTVAPTGGWPTENRRVREAIYQIESIAFNDGHPILLDIALVAQITYDYSKKHHLSKDQCFWYADIICRVLEAIASGAIVKHTRNANGFGEPRGGAPWVPEPFRALLLRQAADVLDIYRSDKQALLTEISMAERDWKRMVYRASDQEVQRQRKEEVIKRTEDIVGETELARKGEKEARKRVQDLQRQVEAMRMASHK